MKKIIVILILLSLTGISTALELTGGDVHTYQVSMYNNNGAPTTYDCFIRVEPDSEGIFVDISPSNFTLEDGAIQDITVRINSSIALAPNNYSFTLCYYYSFNSENNGNYDNGGSEAEGSGWIPIPPPPEIRYEDYVPPDRPDIPNVIYYDLIPDQKPFNPFIIIIICFILLIIFLLLYNKRRGKENENK